MKRFKDCKLCCVEGQSSLELLRNLKDACSSVGGDVEISSYNEEYKSLVVSFSSAGNPKASLVLYAKENGDCVSIMNVFPEANSGIKELDIDSYNAILDAFKNLVFAPIAHARGNSIVENSAEYDIEEIIPVSYRKLETWLSNYPLSGHILDRNRWYDFVIALITNHEAIDPFVFRDYLINVADWSDEDAENYANKLEEQLSLLGRFNEKK